MRFLIFDLRFAIANCRLPILVVMCVCAAVASIARADSAALAHVDAIEHQVEIGKQQVKQLNADLHVARIANAEIVAQRDNERTWRINLENSVPYWIGWLIWTGFKWWLLVVAIVFVARMIFVYIGGPIGAAGAQVTTFLLGVLTCFITYLAAIPDNLFFRGQIEKLKAENDQLKRDLNGARTSVDGGVK